MIFPDSPVSRRPRIARALPLVVWASLTPVVLAAQQSVASRESGPVAVVTRITGAPPIIDGRLDDEAWSLGEPLTAFFQREPVEGDPVSERTEVRIVSDGEALYLGAWLYDRNPDEIVSGERLRDANIQVADHFGIILDTYRDRQNGFVFATTPSSIEYDGQVVNEGEGGGRVAGSNRQQRGSSGGFNLNWDASWEVATTRNGDGWYAEFKIPFATLRYAGGSVQTWGLNMVRRIRRRNEESFWAPVPRQYNLVRLSLAGDLAGVPVPTQRAATVSPYLLTSVERDYVNSAGDTDYPSEIGGDAKITLTPSLTLDLTTNTDFAQVEVDEQRTNLTRFPLFFPEKRPFFLEGTEIFGLPKQLVFTRTIVDPITGAKLTGKVGGASVGYLGAADQAGDDGDTYVNLVRLRQDLGAASTVGAIYTDRTRSSADFNRVTGLEGRFVMARRYTLQVQGAGSWDRDDGGSTTTGGLFYAQLARAGRGLTFSALFEDLSTDFKPESGFIRRLAEAHAQTQVSYNWYGGRGALVERWGPSLEVQGYWDHESFWDGNRWNEAEARLMMSLSLRNNVSVWLTARRSEFSAPAEDYDGLATRPGGVPQPFLPDSDQFTGLNSFNAFMYASGYERLRGRISADFKEVPIFYRSTGAPVDVANSWGGEISLTILPSRFLSMEAAVRHAVLNRKLDGSRYSRATIPRINAQYQFNRALFLRATVEYASAELGEVRDPVTGLPLESCDEEGCDPLEGSSDNGILVEGLLSYEPSPGTVFFFGYTRQMEDASRFGFEDVHPTADGLFAKLSYRFRL